MSELPTDPSSQSFALRVRDLATTFVTDEGEVRAVDGVSLEIAPGATLGLVGESGCGKSVTALSILGLLPAHAAFVERGTVEISGDRGPIELVALGEAERAAVRGDRIAMIFQDPMSSLNPMMTIGEQLAEGLRAHRGLTRAAARERSVALLRKVGIPAPEERLDTYPHQLSGGMRQRVMIAMAIACGPRVLLADEPTTALDVTIQAQVLELLRTLRDESGMALLLITHDLAVVSEIADEVAVMYAGRIVERGPTRQVLEAPLHPYTQGLVRSIPSRAVREGATEAERAKLRLPTIPGTVPALGRWPEGCRFADRCERVEARCRERSPTLVGQANGGEVACFRAGEDVSVTATEPSA